MESSSSPRSAFAIRGLPGVAAALAIGVGVAVLGGWAWDVDRLKRVLPGLVSMNPATAIAFIIAGISLALQQRKVMEQAPEAELGPASDGERPANALRIAQACAAIVVCIGGFRLAAIIFDPQTAIDQLLFTGKLVLDNPEMPNRMAPNAAFAFVLLGLALLTLDVNTRRRERPAELFAFTVLLMSLFALIGYAYQAQWLYGMGKAIPMALHTAAMFHLLAFGILYARPDQGLMKLVTADSPGGAMARRMFFFLVPVLVTVGWLRLAGERSGYYDTGLGVAFHTLASITIIGGLIWWSAKSLHSADEVRRQSDEERERFFVLSLDMLCIAEADGFLKRINPAFSKTLGYPEDQLVGHSLLPFVHQDDQAPTIEELARLAQGMPTIEFENRCRCRDGTWKWFSWSIQPYLAEGLLYAAAREITERKLSEEALRESEKRANWSTHFLDSVIENLPTMIFVKDAETLKFVRVNRVAEHLTGLPRDELLGKSDVDFYPPDEARFFEQKDRELLARGQMIDIPEETLSSATLGVRLLHTKKMPVYDETGRPKYILGVSEDITERKLAEAELLRSRSVFESLFEALPGNYLVLSPDLKIVTANKAYLEATMTRRDNIVGRGMFEVFPDNPDDAKANGTSNLRSSLYRVLKTGAADTMAIQRYDVRRPDGTFEERFWTPVNSPLIGINGEIEYIIHGAEDVTDFVRQKSASSHGSAEMQTRMEQMEAEIFLSSQKVQATNMQLEAANKELETFSYSVSHDLRAPLRHIQGYVEMLEMAVESQLTDKPRRYLKTIKDVAVEMGQLIDDLLDFSRISRASLHETNVPLDKLVADTVRGLEMVIKDRQISWKITPLPPVLGDPSALKQVMANLIGNAVKYTRKRDTAEIEIGCAGEEAGQTVLFVRDNGAGFDMKYADKLFGVFQRLHRSDEFEGTGIGLATVRRIIGRHGGRTWAEGAVNNGAAIYFTLKPALSN